MVRLPKGEELPRLIEESKVRVAAMTPEQLAGMVHQQAQSYARSLQPCPHGKRDFEECTACRGEAVHTVTFDYLGHLVIDGEIITRLSPNQQKFLEIILSNNRVISREFMLTYIYPHGNEPDLKVFDVMVSQIRRRLKNHRALFDTVWGRGWVRSPQYSFIKPNPTTLLVPLPEGLLHDLLQFYPEQTLPEIITPLLKKKLKELFNGQEQ